MTTTADLEWFDRLWHDLPELADKPDVLRTLIETRIAAKVADLERAYPQGKEVPPGPCWHDSGITWPGETFSVRCDLLAGHAGAHQADRGSRGGTAVWTDAPTPRPVAAEQTTPGTGEVGSGE